MNKYYLAYGSNLSMAQMAQRCPDAVYVGTAELKDYQLLFKGKDAVWFLSGWMICKHRQLERKEQ